MTLGACAWLSGAGVVSAQGPAAGPPAEFRYLPDQLRCLTLQERSRAVLEAQTDTKGRRETLARYGRWRLRGRPAPGGTAIEAWYDTLTLSRESPEGTLSPDTDGLLGGRFRGALSPTGRYRAAARPFVPDEVAEVSDLGAAMDDLFPPLPPAGLAVGEQWSDSTGVELRRLPDSSAQGRVVRRLALRSRVRTDRAALRGDTTAIAVHQVTVEDGRVDWDETTGFLRRTRHIVVETSVAAGGPVRTPLRSRLEQDVELVRINGDCQVGSGGSPP